MEKSIHVSWDWRYTTESQMKHGCNVETDTYWHTVQACGAARMLCLLGSSTVDSYRLVDSAKTQSVHVWLTSMFKEEEQRFSGIQAKTMAGNVEEKSKHQWPENATQAQHKVDQTPRMLGHKHCSDLGKRLVEWTKQQLSPGGINHDSVKES